MDMKMAQGCTGRILMTAMILTLSGAASRSEFSPIMCINSVPTEPTGKTFASHFHDSQILILNDFGDPLTFLLAPEESYVTQRFLHTYLPTPR